MSEYTRLFLHFLHALGETRRVSTFLFGTRLTNVTRAMRARDPDEALAQAAKLAVDWSGGTRIGEAIGRFNREWARRVLGQGAIVILFTDGLERDGLSGLGHADGTAAKIEPARDLGQSAAAFRRLCRPGCRAFARSCRMSTPFGRSTTSPAWPISAQPCGGAGTRERIRGSGSKFRPDASVALRRAQVPSI